MSAGMGKAGIRHGGVYGCSGHGGTESTERHGSTEGQKGQRKGKSYIRSLGFTSLHTRAIKLRPPMQRKAWQIRKRRVSGGSGIFPAMIRYFTGDFVREHRNIKGLIYPVNILKKEVEV